MDLGLRDRVFVVTAASSGLGRASARALVDEGAKVVLVARRADVLAEVVADLGEQNAAALTADLGEASTPVAAVDLALERFGRLDGALVSCGGPPAGRVIDMTDDQWTHAFGSVFLAGVRTAREVITRGTAADLALALVLSTSAKQPIGGLAISNGLRPGLAMVVKQLSDEHGPDGVRVLGLLPGRVDTERVRHLDSLSDDPAAARAASEAAIPLRRIGQPTEFGRVAAFLLSPAASYVTGSVIPVDGGAIRAL